MERERESVCIAEILIIMESDGCDAPRIIYVTFHMCERSSINADVFNAAKISNDEQGSLVNASEQEVVGK